MSRSKRIGTAFESQVADYLTAAGIPCHRVALAGCDDEGDIRHGHLFVLECKGGKAAASASRNQIVEWLADTERERANAGVPFGFLVTKVAGKGVAQAGLWLVHVSGRELWERWGARVPAGTHATVTLDVFIDWWLSSVGVDRG